MTNLAAFNTICSKDTSAGWNPASTLIWPCAILFSSDTARSDSGVPRLTRRSQFPQPTCPLLRRRTCLNKELLAEQASYQVGVTWRRQLSDARKIRLRYSGGASTLDIGQHFRKSANLFVKEISWRRKRWIECRTASILLDVGTLVPKRQGQNKNKRGREGTFSLTDDMLSVYDKKNKNINQPSPHVHV